MTPKCSESAIALYRTFVLGQCLHTEARIAEMAKLTENAFRDVNIAFANELSLICHRLGIDVWELVRLANQHPRVNILQPGPGVGGHCIAVDPWFIIHSAPEQSRLIRTARNVNNSKSDWVFEQVAVAAKRFTAPRIACMGLAFKPDVDDLRQSPSLMVAERLAAEKVGEIFAVEPHIVELPAYLKAMPNVRFADAKTALNESDIVVALVNHGAFKEISRANLAGKIVIDACGMWR
jgi:UDP-N-acetyl-D-mannosaminuronic acid dehydrogenase